jgi:Domain of unknown function (DUF1707)
MDGPEQRASDEDRQRVVRDLERHAAAGRLTLDEYAERVDRALASRTHGQLAEVTADLPAVPETEPADDDQAHAGSARQLGVAFLIALAALVVVLGLVALKH